MYSKTADEPAARWPGAPADQFVLERGEEALGDGAIEAVAARAHRSGDPGGASLLAEGQAPELAALDAVPDQPGTGPPLRERHLQRIGDALGAHLIGHAS